MGPFHIHCSFIKVINKLFHGFGLSNILVTSGVISEGSVYQALQGKHYKRSIRCLRLLYEAFFRRLILHSLNHGAFIPKDVIQWLRILCDQSWTPQKCQESYCQLKTNSSISIALPKKIERIKISGSPVAKYWMSFIEMVETLRMNLHLLRTRNWEFMGYFCLMW